MDTPLVKILLIAAAIAITVGVIVLAWGIFNQATAEVEVDGTASALSGGNLEIGSKADVLRSRITNERACRAAGYQWFDADEGIDGGKIRIDSVARSGSTPGKRGYQQVSGSSLLRGSSNERELHDHTGTTVNEGETHCAVNGGIFQPEGTPRATIWLYSSRNNGDGKDYRRFAIIEP